MIVESNNAIATDVLGDLLKNLAPVLQPTRSKAKTKTNRILCARFFPRFEGKLQVVGGILIGSLLCLLVLIGRTDSFGIGYSTVI